MTRWTITCKKAIILSLSAGLVLLLHALSRARSHGDQQRDENWHWREVEVPPDMLGVALELVALSAVVVALAVEVFSHQGLAWIPFLLGTPGLGFAIFALVRLYRVYLWQRGLLRGSSVRDFLTTPYGFLALAFALIMTLALFTMGLLTAQATL